MKPAGWLIEGRRLEQLVQPAIVFAVALTAVLLVRHFLLRYFARRSKPSAGIFVSAIRLPSILWSLAAALDISLQFAELTRAQVVLAEKLIAAFVIISLTLVAQSMLLRMIGSFGERQGMPFAMMGLSRALVRVVVLALGAMALLRYFDKPITPLITALGVGGIAVALALQDTLANFFAGVHILMERPLFVNDFIRLESGQEGIVTDIGWRTTRVRTGANDMVVVPNTKITSGVLVNYSLPQHRGAVEIAVLVAHEADPEQVCRIAVEEAAQAEGVLADPAPVCLCDPGVLPTHVQFKLIVHVASRLQQGGVQSTIRIRLMQRFRAERIPLPKPELANAYWR